MWLLHDMHRSRESHTCLAHPNTRTCSPRRLMLSPVQSKRARSSVGGTRAGFGVRSLTWWICCTRLTSIRQVKLRRNPPTYAAIDDVLGMHHREPCICRVFVMLDYAISFEHQFTVVPCIVLFRVYDVGGGVGPCVDGCCAPMSVGSTTLSRCMRVSCVRRVMR